MQIHQTRSENINSVGSTKDSIEINSNKGNPIIGNSKNSSFPEKPLFKRGIQVLKDIGENGKISEGEKLQSMERKFPTILKVIVGIFTIGIGAAIMHKIEEKYSSEDLSASKGIANELAKLRHAIEQLENGKTEKIKFCDVDIKVKNEGDEKFSIKNGENKFEVSKKSLENNIAKNIDLLNKKNASEFVEDSMLKGGKYLEDNDRFEKLANKILESSTNTNLENLNAKNTSKETIYRVVKRVATEKAKSEKEVKEKFNEETLIGSNDARKIRENFEKASAEEKSRVKIEKTEKKSSEKVEGASVDSINQVNKVDGNQKQNKITPQDVHNFVADIILNDDAFIHDKNVSKPGERMRQTFIKHLGTFVALLNEEISLNTLDKYFKLIMGAEMRKMRKAINKGKTINEGNAGKSNYTIDDVKNFLEKRCFEGEKGEKEYSEIFSKMEKSFDGTVKRAADKMQDSLSEQLKNICSGGTNKNPKILEKIKKQISDFKAVFSEEVMIENLKEKYGAIPEEARKFLENVYKEFDEISNLCAESKNSEYINDKLKKLNECMSYLSYMRRARDKKVTDEDLIKDGKAIFLNIKRCLLEDKLENALGYLEKHGKPIDESKNKELIGISKIIEDLKNGKEVTNDMINGTGYYKSNDGNINPIKLKEDLKREISILNVKINNLETLMVQSGTDLNSDGYGKFMQNVMGRYMNEIPLIDKRSMVAAGIRYYQKSKPPSRPEKGEEDYEKKLKKFEDYQNNKENFKAKEESKQFGAILKGAGPIMQKMLQGLKTGNEEFDSAIEDMKSNLAPINEDMIKAYLYDAVKNSNGQIKNIAVKKSLGAASVGQALLCEIEDKDGNKKECVVKLLRPDVYNRAMREKEISEQAAREVPGMEITFDGQLKSIMDELDLKKEAKNVEDGKVYNNAFSDVKSMNIIRPPEPTKNILILEKAPGQTIDSYINKGKEGGVYKNIVDLIDKIGNGKDKSGTSEDAVSLKGALDELLRAQKALINLSTVWVTEGIYGNGFYHGDLHAGNMMIDPNVEEIDKTTGETKKNAKLTVIDFGNATKLTKDQQSDIMLMMSSAAVGDEELFMKGFRRLLTENGKKDWDKKQDVLRRIFKEVLNKGDEKSTGERIAVALTEAQKQGIEIPAPIFKFSQCQIRLSNAVNSMNKAIEDIKKMIENKKIKLNLDRDTEEYLDEPDNFFDCMANVINSNLTSSLWKLGLWDAFKIRMQM